jgi:putative thioredoxin
MNMNDNIIDVTEADFEYQVIAFSQQIPVVVDFWAEWCGPCRTLGPLLERLASQAGGSFRLAKVNVDENPNLARRFDIRSIPAVKGFRNGQAVADFTGAIPEPQVREFLKKLVPDETMLALEKGLSLLRERDFLGAETSLRDALQDEPLNPGALLGLARALLYQGRGREATQIIDHFPASKELAAAHTLRPLAHALEDAVTNGVNGDDPLAAAYQRALLLIERRNLPAALDGLLDILREDKRYLNGEAHRVVLALFELLGQDDPFTQEYRRELANILF